MPRGTLGGASLVALVLALVLTAGPAGAAFNDGTDVAAHAVATAALTAPTAPAITDGPCNAITGPTLRVTWTPTSSTWADGYEIGQSLTAGGPYVTLYTASGQSTATFTTPSLTFSTRYYFVVRSTKHSWRSAASSEVSRTTKALLCL